MPDILYAVHTRTCTYLLDEEGVCRWIVSPGGLVAPDVRRCVGAQFVACLDVRVPGGLAGELRIGATALFVATAEDNPAKLVLLRTAAIQHVEFRDASEALPQATDTLHGTIPGILPPLNSPERRPLPQPPPASHPLPAMPRPPPPPVAAPPPPRAAPPPPKSSPAPPPPPPKSVPAPPPRAAAPIAPLPAMPSPVAVAPKPPASPAPPPGRRIPTTPPGADAPGAAPPLPRRHPSLDDSSWVTPDDSEELDWDISTDGDRDDLAPATVTAADREEGEVTADLERDTGEVTADIDREETGDLQREVTAEVDPDDLVIYAGEEATVTLTLPLFRPEVQPPSPPAWKVNRSKPRV